LLLPFIGVFCWVKLEKKMIRREVKHQIMENVDEHQLVTFRFALSDTAKLLDWEHANEFEYKGEMYDVVRRVYRGEFVTYHLWWDHKETALNKQVDLLAQSIFNNHPNKEKTAKHISFILHQLMLNDCSISTSKPITVLTNHAFTYFNHYSSIPRDSSSPPPKFLCA
jgi:hypothetical protein